MTLEIISDTSSRTGQSGSSDLRRVIAPELLTTEQVSTVTGVAVETLNQWRSQKRGLAYLKIGKLVRYDVRDVERFLDTCRVSVSPRRRK